jgi:formylglycine-generating enzyme required for sulfatase activity
MAQPKIFVSHSHQDTTYCREFVAALRQAMGSNEAVWYDEHNLGWGKLRREIEQELAQRQHFIAILSPAAVSSDWVNDEIDAAIELRRRGSMQTLQFVIALPCEMPLLLSNYKRVVAPDGQSYSAREAAVRALAVIQPSFSAVGTTSPASPQPEPQVPVIPPDRFPQRLADLGFTAYFDHGVEYILPPLCTVPAGPFLMGSDPNWDKGAYRDEQPQHLVILPAYEIACFPVTVAEYACFVRAGYAEYQNWHSQLSRLDHPVVNVTWYDAVAYAIWLSGRTTEVWRLPTEAQWEKAARGADGRIFPWGGIFDKARCNTKESGIGATTPVGNYPSGASLYGAQDMAGNVWEWTSSLKLPYPYITSSGREDGNSAGNRVLRGGSWNGVARTARGVS